MNFLCFPWPWRPYFINTWVHSIRILVLGLTCLLDRFMYGTWVLVPLNFLKFNFLSSGGDYYGTHKWHWYFTQGFTVMIFSYLPFCIAGIIYSKQWKLSGLLAWVLGFYSLLGHKEFRYSNLKIYISMLTCIRSILLGLAWSVTMITMRYRFVLPVLPIALMFSGYSLAAIEDPGSARYKGKESSKTHTRCPTKMRIAILFLLATNIPMALYMSLVHQVSLFFPSYLYLDLMLLMY